MTTRQRYEVALGEWIESLSLLKVALSDFMDDGVRTQDGVWILTMSQSRAAALRTARQRVDAAKVVLDRMIDDLLLSPRPEGFH